MNHLADRQRPDQLQADQRRGGSSAFGRRVGAELRVLIVAGITTGVLVIGLGSRLAMFVLRLTSPDGVDGVRSDDGFTIGRVTLAGSYNLLVLGAIAGVIGAAAYQWVRPWLLGPRWFRLVTLAAAAGAVVGSMLIHADGIDFRALEPMWLAVSLFVALPAAFAVCIAIAVDRVEHRVAVASRWRHWILPAVLVGAFPPVLIVLAFGLAGLLVWVAIRDHPAMRRAAAAAVTGVLARVAWLGIAVLGLVTLLRDIAELRAIA